jgi:hypothetical protein
MGLSGVHKKEVKAEVARLKKAGATDIVVGEDDNKYEPLPGEPKTYHKGPWHTIDYKM